MTMRREGKCWSESGIDQDEGEESWKMTNMMRNMYIVAGAIVFFVLMNNTCGRVLIYLGCQTEYLNTINGI
jgi:hypothetical protein